MLYLKQTVTRVKETIFSDKAVNELQNSLLLQLVFLSTLKNYLYKAVAQEPLFIIPENVLRISKNKRKVLVLDMDQTLVYTRRESKPIHKNYKTVKHEDTDMHIQFRPMLQEFLHSVSQIFDVYIYTAGNKQYADAVLDQISANGLIQKRFYRETCKKQNGNYFKDLKHLKRISRNNTQMILVDDNAVSVGHNYPFAIKIKQFEGDQKDRELATIFQNLLKFYL